MSNTIVDQFNSISPAAQYLISNYFIEQLKSPQYRNNSHFFVKAEALQQRLFEVTLSNPAIIEEGDGTTSVAVRIQLSHLIMPKGEGDSFELINIAKVKGGSTHEHNRGHYAALKLGAGAVELGLLQPENIDQLVNYAYQWEANGDSSYTTGAEEAKQRVWLAPKGNKGYVCFQLSERADTKGNMVPALEGFTWTANDFTLIGKGISAPAPAASSAPSLFTSEAPANTPVATPGGRKL